MVELVAGLWIWNCSISREKKLHNIFSDIFRKIKAKIVLYSFHMWFYLALMNGEVSSTAELFERGSIIFSTFTKGSISALLRYSARQNFILWERLT
jgi:hypothetical protein